MADKTYIPSGGISTYQNPLLVDGQLIHSLNMTTAPFGAKTKRMGYSSFLGTPDTSQVQSLFSFPNINNDGTTLNLYRASGSSLYYSIQGTGSWTLSSNGTISSGAHVGHAILGNTMIAGDGVGSTRHTTSGTSFTDTTLAPPSADFLEYHRRIYALGTSQTEFYSTTNDATNWDTSGTSDSSSFQVPGAGKLLTHFKAEDKVIIAKSQGQLFKWDDFSLIDAATSAGPSSPYSIDETEGFYFFLNQLGLYGHSGGKPQLLSNAIQRQFYNDAQTGIAGTAFASIPAECHRYDYLASVGDITDDFTQRTISNAIIKYDYQKNEFLNWQFAKKPTALHSYKDTTGSLQLIFGDSLGQVYKLDTSYTDNGSPITSEMVFVYHHGAPFNEKKWDLWEGIFNPGCEANIQIACSDTYTYQSLRWEDLGQALDGHVEYRFPQGGQSHFLFVRIYDASPNSRYTYYGSNIAAQVQPRRT